MPSHPRLVPVQLLERDAAPLLATGFPTLLDLIVQTFDDGPGKGAVPLYLQVFDSARFGASGGPIFLPSRCFVLPFWVTKL